MAANKNMKVFRMKNESQSKQNNTMKIVLTIAALAFAVLAVSFIAGVFASDDAYADDTADVSSWSELSTALGDAEVKTINITADITAESRIDFIKGVTLNGNGHTITQKSNGLFGFNSGMTGNVEIKDLKIVGAKFGEDAVPGYGIYCRNIVQIKITNCEFSGVFNPGGAPIIAQDESTNSIIMDGCKFTGSAVDINISNQGASKVTTIGTTDGCIIVIKNVQSRATSDDDYASAFNLGTYSCGATDSKYVISSDLTINNFDVDESQTFEVASEKTLTLNGKMTVSTGTFVNNGTIENGKIAVDSYNCLFNNGTIKDAVIEISVSQVLKNLNSDAVYDGVTITSSVNTPFNMAQEAGKSASITFKDCDISISSGNVYALYAWGGSVIIDNSEITGVIGFDNCGKDSTLTVSGNSIVSEIALIASASDITYTYGSDVKVGENATVSKLWIGYPDGDRSWQTFTSKSTFVVASNVSLIEVTVQKEGIFDVDGKVVLGTLDVNDGTVDVASNASLDTYAFEATSTSTIIKNGKFTISCIITIVADDATKVYDGNPLTAGYSLKGDIVGDLTVDVEGAITNVGKAANKVVSYTIMFGDVDLKACYTNIILVDGSLTVTKASVTVTYESETVKCGGTPAYKLNYSGIISGQSEKDFTVIPKVYMSSPIVEGKYTLTPAYGSASNYDFIYLSGVLTVEHDIKAVEKSGNIIAHYMCDGCGEHFIDAAATVKYTLPEAGSTEQSVGTEATVSDGKATVDSSKVTEIDDAVKKIKESDSSAIVVAELSTSDSSARSFSVDSSDMAKLAGNASGVKLSTSTISATFSSSIVKDIATAGKFDFNASKATSYPSQYKNLIGANGIVLDISLSVDDKAVTQFDEKVTLSFYYVIPVGHSVSELKVWCISGDSPEEFKCTYDETTHIVTAETSHFSQYAVTLDSSSGSSDSNNTSLYIICGVIVAIVVILMIDGIVVKKH